MSGAVYLAGVRLDTPFALWLLAFYFVTLAQLAAAFVRVLRAAPMEAVREPRIS
jgi:hypothetical protein